MNFPVRCLVLFPSLFGFAARTNLRNGRELLAEEKKPIRLTVTNLSYQQPLSGFFVMVHSQDAEPLFTYGEPATMELAELAENGNPDLLSTLYGQDVPGVLSAESVAPTSDGPLLGGESFDLDVDISKQYPLVTIASMAVNTNDCFVAVNGDVLLPGSTKYYNGLDAGTEENNEECNSIPGPACADTPGNVESGNGEGFVHTHRGFHGIGDLSAAGYDWRNPMMKVAIALKPTDTDSVAETQGVP